MGLRCSHFQDVVYLAKQIPDTYVHNHVLLIFITLNFVPIKNSARLEFA